MDKEKIKQILKEILTDLEIKVYLACLEGPLTIQELAKKANLNRSGTYRIIEGLINKGLLAKEIKQRGQRILAEHPRKVLQILSNEQRKLRREELSFQELLPEILSEYNIGVQNPKVRFYEGIEGFKNIMEQVVGDLEIEKSKEYKVFAPTELFLEILQKHCPEIIKKRIALGVKMKFITSSSTLAKERRGKIDKEELRERRILPKEFGFESVIIIFGGKVAILDLGREIMGLVIENIKINKTINTFFEFIWEGACDERGS